jgi:hypothetical protein
MISPDYYSLSAPCETKSALREVLLEADDNKAHALRKSELGVQGFIKMTEESIHNIYFNQICLICNDRQ